MPPRPPVNVDYLSFRESGQFSQRDVAYAEQDPSLRPFMAHAPSLPAFAQAIEARAAVPTDRRTLIEVLAEQYAGYGAEPPENLALLADERTFTVTTAHQASLFLGPLYYVYKILSAVALARQLEEVYPRYAFVPAFVLGAEDHDLEEIDHLTVAGERVSWRTRQTGATGAMSLAEIAPALERVDELLGRSTPAREIVGLLRRCYRPDRTLAVATGHFVAELFGAYGVVVANLNHGRLKRSFAPAVRREVLQQTSRGVIAETVGALETAGFAQQAHAREINLFYLAPGRRDRLVPEPGGRIGVLDGPESWSTEEFERELREAPERFSPNVVMRPLLQETALPNLAYVGGGGELAYWLERKDQFAAFGVPMPVLVRRDSAWWITAEAGRRLERLALAPRDLLGDYHELLARVARRGSAHDVDFADHLARLRAMHDDIAERAAAVDPTLRKRALAHGVRAAQAVEQLEKRLVRTLKKQQADTMERVADLHRALLPGGGLQERETSFLDLYARHGRGLFDTLLEHFDPLDMRLKVFVEQA